MIERLQKLIPSDISVEQNGDLYSFGRDGYFVDTCLGSAEMAMNDEQLSERILQPLLRALTYAKHTDQIGTRAFEHEAKRTLRDMQDLSGEA